MSTAFLTKTRLNRLLKIYPPNSFVCNQDGKIITCNDSNKAWIKSEKISNLTPAIIGSLAQRLLEETIISRKSEHIEDVHQNTPLTLSCTPLQLSRATFYLFTVNHNVKASSDLGQLRQKLYQYYQDSCHVFFQLNTDQNLISHGSTFSKLCRNYDPNLTKLLHQPLTAILPSQLAEKLIQQASLVVEADIATNCEVEIENNKTANKYHMKIIPVKSTANEIIGTIFVGQLIPPIKEKTLPPESNFENSLIGNLPSYVYWKDTEHSIIGGNINLLSTFRDSIADTAELTFDKNLFYKQMSPDEAEQIEKNDKQILTQKTTINFEEKATHNGKTLTYFSQKSPLNIDGEILGICGISTDITAYIELITELKKKNTDLQNDLTRLSNESTKTEEHLNWIIDHLPGNVFWENKEGVFLGCNKQLINWLELTDKNELIGKNLLEMPGLQDCDKESLLRIRKNDLEVMKTKQEKIFEENLSHKGKTVSFLTHKSPMMAGDECIGIIGVGLDITNQKDLEEQLKKANRLAQNALQAKSDFIANISHDLRTPLHTICGTAEQLENEPHLPSQSQKIDTLIKCSQLILRLVDNVLHFSQLKDGTLQLHERPCDLKQLLESIILTFKPLAKKKNIEFDYNIKNLKNHYVVVDANALSRILINLIQNAMKHTHEGEVNITVVEKRVNRMTSNYTFSVSDTGSGIQKEELAHIFSRFYQGEKHKGHGLGLGLSITQRFTELMSGHLSVDSKWGIGSRFTCTIPLTLCEEIPKEKNTLYQAKQKPRILLVEDNELIQTMTVQTLKKLDWEYELAATGEDALIAWKKGNLSLVLLDLGLPDKPGLEVLKTIRQFDQSLPIITLTGDGSEKTKAACFEAGATGFLIKPTTQEDLLNAITETLSACEA